MDRLRTGKEIECPTCKYKFYVKKSQLYRRKYCSKKCMNIGFTGRKLSKEIREKISKSNKGRTVKHIDLLHKNNIGRKNTMEQRIRMSLAQTREKEFTGFKKSLRSRIMIMREYLQWRSDVFKRDNYHCQNCGEKGYLEAYHILAFSVLASKFKINTIDDSRKCKELWDIGNGITYCRECHILLDEYRGKRGIGRYVKIGS